MIGEGESEMEGQTKELSPEATNETLEIIEQSILETEITPQNSPSFALQYLRWTINGFEHILNEKPEGLTVLRDYVDFLKESLVEGQQGEFENVARFMRAEAEKNRDQPQRNALGLKFEQIADNLTRQNTP